ncbi:hypothetical protein Q1695_007188 [Nippostrongylus brasiliensis]|nr:hypothetical protein Q1695_007188 [Nippostrongylus brasiliensis]
MRARLPAAVSLLVSSAVFYYRMNVISKAPLDTRYGNSFSRKEVCQGFQSRLEQVRSGTFPTAPFNRSQLLPPLMEYAEKFHIAPPYHFLICRIQKVMSTVLDAASCYITNSTEFNASNRTISTEKGGTYRFCRNQNIASNLDAALSAVKPPRLQLAVVRHPIEKFLSGFVQRCISLVRRIPTICYSCKGDMVCFVHQLTKYLREVHEKKEGKSAVGMHFAPQSWFCRFNDTIDQFRIIKYRGGTEGAAYLATEFNRVFRDAGVPENLRNVINKEMLVGRSHHSTHGSEDRRKAERTLMSNFTLLTEVVRLYYYDFVLFDYELPSMF